MSEKTHAEIIAEMRDNDGDLCPWLVDGGTCEYCPLGHSPHGKDLWKYCSFHKLSCELEAAHKRELAIKDAVIQTESAARLAEQERHKREIAELKKQIGNAAKLREAATAENSSVVGNIAKLREAVKLALSLLDLDGGTPYKTISQKDLDFMKAALAAPARNCDVGTAEEQERRFKEFCAAHWSINNVDSECAGCPLTIEGAECEFAWAQMPYKAEKGDAKWSKK